MAKPRRSASGSPGGVFSSRVNGVGAGGKRMGKSTTYSSSRGGVGRRLRNLLSSVVGFGLRLSFGLLFISFMLLVFFFLVGLHPPALERETQIRWEHRAGWWLSFLSTASVFEGYTPVSYRTLHVLASVRQGSALHPLVGPLTKLALYLGADVNATDSQGSTALHYAARHGDLDTIQLLVESEANIFAFNQRGQMPPELLARKAWKKSTWIRKAVRTMEHFQAKARWNRRKANEDSRTMASRTVERIPHEELSYERFINEFALQRKPVIIEGYKNITLNGHHWSKEHLAQRCGSSKVRLEVFDPTSTAWANLRQGDLVRLDRWIAQWNSSAENPGMVFDWPLPRNCPEILKEFTMPKYFAEDYIQHTQFDELRDSWPSLFIAHNGTKSGLHIDAFGSNFWMLMIEGHKQWRFFDPDERAFLYPNLNADNFFADVYNPNYEKYPLLRLTTAYDTIVGPGDLLFVPGGVPHQVRNLDETIAISGNYVDSTCMDLAEMDALIYKLDGDNDYTAWYDLLQEVDRTLPENQPDLPYADYRRGYWVDGVEVDAFGKPIEDDEDYEAGGEEEEDADAEAEEARKEQETEDDGEDEDSTEKDEL